MNGIVLMVDKNKINKTPKKESGLYIWYGSKNLSVKEHDAVWQTEGKYE